MIPASVARAVERGLKMKTFAGEVRTELAGAGELVVGSGRIAVWDPELGVKDSALETSLRPGRYPVQLCLANYPDKDQRVAAAWVEVKRGAVKSWRMATPEAVHVESGVVCVADAETAERRLSKTAADRKRFRKQVEAEVERNYRDTRSWGEVRADPATGANALFFSSGFGDGVYGNYVGLDDKGDVACLLIDFGLLLTAGEIEEMGDGEF